MYAGEFSNLTVLLLCGGKGERLRPLTDSIPKPLIKIRNKPILHYLISHFEKFGFKKFVVATGYRAEILEEYFKTNHRHLEVQLVNSGDADISKRIQDCSPYLTSDFVMGYGDTLANVDLAQLVSSHRASNQILTMTTYPLQTQFGVVEIDSKSMVTNFVEKPVLDKWINIGYYCCNNSLLNEIQGQTSFVQFLSSMVEQRKLAAYRHKGVHITVNTLKELDDAEENILSFEKALPPIGLDLSL
jgi:glucose-1-phosphate cytidylyltransferase